MAYLESTDKILKEGWWKKKGGKGHIDHLSVKNRYIVLTDRYLDWYQKPGDKRLGCIQLDSIYVREEGNVLVVGDSMKNGKEFRLITEGSDSRRVNEWHKAITKAMDDYRDLRRKGATKLVIEKGFDVRADKPEPAKTEYVVEEKVIQHNPGGGMVMGVQTTSYDVQPPASYMAKNQYPGAHVAHHAGPPTAATTTTTVVVGGGGGGYVHPMMAQSPSPPPLAVYPQHQTIIMTQQQQPPPPPIHTMMTPPMMTVSTPVMSMGPPVMTLMQPQVPSYVPPQMHMMSTQPQMISCAFCRQIFQSPGSQAFACPYCRQINQLSQPPTFM
eukprot:TRINITY_DN2549_c0_g1_i6.p1 TRINITY_DN2549_c0_g1~~TRINITY_DN2549_c0_g1_i6.p1  ORF type:complete len:348 (-),score=118.89 TRINITY_DN2549_c0_g1_i6:145-1125(-)